MRWRKVLPWLPREWVVQGTPLVLYASIGVVYAVCVFSPLPGIPIELVVTQLLFYCYLNVVYLLAAPSVSR